MAEDLVRMLNDLKTVRTYLVKIGPDRRTGKIVNIKKEEANKLFEEYNTFVNILKSQESYQEQRSLTDKICLEIQRIYLEIIDLCSGSGSKKQSSKMSSESFDLKIALNLLPVMNDNDDTTKQLIEGIEYYSAVLSNEVCKNKLIQFVLKSRLSQKAKLLLCSKYDTIDDLIRDMRKILLPQKSYTALHAKLQQSRQNEKSISDFGRELSELFVDLTISQADGNSKNYEILRPLNEKLAIKRFSDGLRNRRTSTIIAARNFSSLSDAVQSAMDEELSAPSTSSEFIGTYKRPHHFNGPKRFQRGTYNGYYYNARNRIRASNHQPSPARTFPTYQRREGAPRGNRRGNGFRARSNYRAYRGRNHSAHSNVNVIEAEQNNTINEVDDQTLTHFFRA